MSPKIKWFLLSFGVIAFLVLSVFQYGKELTYFTNTFKISSLTWMALGSGLSIGLLIGFFGSRAETFLLDKVKIFAIAIAISLYLAPLVFSKLNRSFVISERSQEFMLFRMENRSSTLVSLSEGTENSRESHYYVITKDKLKKIKKSGMNLEEIDLGDSVTFVLKKGLFGFEFVPYY